ncbi:MAG: DUF3991 and toprim domain-containing protein [Methylohalobius sp. ZOD2]
MIEDKRDELEQFKRDINIVEYAAAQGYKIDRRESSRSSVVLRGHGDDKIIVATDRDGHGIYFSVRDEADNGSIIDFVQRRKGLNLGQVRRELRQWIGKQTDPSLVTIRKPNPTNRNRPRIQGWWMQMKPQPSGGHSYLRRRGLSTEILEDLRFASMIRMDHRGNAVFPHHDRDGLSGYELKNEGFTGFSKGGEKRIWHTTNIMRAPRIVVVESAVDALSHAQITGDTEAAYISIGGQPSPEQWELLHGALAKAEARGAEVIIGTDTDPAGDRLAEHIEELAPGAEREVPEAGKDWNDQLQHQARQAGTDLCKQGEVAKGTDRHARGTAALVSWRGPC